MPSPSESQWSGHRHLTPPRFARWLLRRVRQTFGPGLVAAIYVAWTGPYIRMAGIEAWAEAAEYYPGPYPIIAHPPCGPWGKCRTLTKYQDPQCGIDAINIVHRFGGVVEQPVGSRLFEIHGRPGAEIEIVNQKAWGHPISKPTLLYWVRSPDMSAPPAIAEKSKVPAEDGKGRKASTLPAETQPVTVPPAPAALPAKPRRAKSVRNPSLCYLICETDDDGHPTSIRAKLDTAHQAGKRAEILLEARVLTARRYGIWRATKVA